MSRGDVHMRNSMSAAGAATAAAIALAGLITDRKSVV